MFEFIRRASPLWGNANFNRLWAAQILSAFGSRITRTALPIIAVSVLSVSPWEAALLAALTYAPYVLAGALCGGFIERGNKTRIMVAMDLFRFAIVIATPVAWYFNLLSFPLLCVLAALAGPRSPVLYALPVLLGLARAVAIVRASEDPAGLIGTIAALDRVEPLYLSAYLLCGLAILAAALRRVRSTTDWSVSNRPSNTASGVFPGATSAENFKTPGSWSE